MTTKPITGFGLAFGLPIDTAVEQLNATARQLDAARAKAPSRDDSFGQRIKNAVQRRMSHSHSPQAEGEQTFGQKVKQAIERRSGRTQHERQADAERNRYRKTQRSHTASD